MEDNVIPSLSLSPSFSGYCRAAAAAAIISEDMANLNIEASGDDDELRNNETIGEGGEDLQTSEDEESEDEEDFTFACGGRGDSAITAEDAFRDGQIRPMFPLFNRDLLLPDYPPPAVNELPLRPPVEKVFVEARDASSLPPVSPAAPAAPASESDDVEAEAAGPYCAWSKKAVEASPKSWKKSNSTGFSRLRRFRDLLNRSNSDGKDAYVFLNGSTAASSKREDKVEKSQASSEKKVGTAGGKSKVKKGVKAGTASLPAHKMHNVRNRAWKEEDRRRTYLPYKPELVGFFTNVNGGLSRNVHPF